MYKLCRHVMPSGARCQSPALLGQAYCYFHRNLHHVGKASTEPAMQTKSGDEVLSLSSIEDARGIQIALTQVLGAMSSGRLDPRQAGLFLYGLQIASQFVARSSAQEPQHIVRSLSEEKSGELLAPEESACEPIQDCTSCSIKNDCIDFTRSSLVSLQRLGRRWIRDQDQWTREDAEREEKKKDPDLSHADRWLLELAEEEVAEAAEQQHDQIDSVISIIKQHGIPYNPENLSPALRARFEQEGIKPKQLSFSLSTHGVSRFKRKNLHKSESANA